MDANNPATLPHHAESLVNLAEALCALPTVPTRGWVDHAATCLCELDHDGVALALLAAVDPAGHVLRLDAVGVGTRRSTPELTQLAQILRTHTSSATTYVPRGSGRPQILASAHLQGSGLEDAARIIHRTVAGAAVAPLNSSSLDRVVMTAILSPSPWTDPARSTSLCAATGLLARRAHLAIGPGIRGESEWLTERERMVLDELSLGKSVRQIADELDRSPHTIHDHVKSLHRKLDASSRGELIARALGHLRAPATTPAPATLAEPKLVGTQSDSPVDNAQHEQVRRLAKPLPRVAG